MVTSALCGRCFLASPLAQLSCWLCSGGSGLQQLPLSSILPRKESNASATQTFIKHSKCASWSETATPCKSSQYKNLLELLMIDSKVGLELTPRDNDQALHWPPILPKHSPLSHGPQVPKGLFCLCPQACVNLSEYFGMGR